MLQVTVGLDHWMSREGSGWNNGDRINGLFHPLTDLLDLLVISWDIKVELDGFLP